MPETVVSYVLYKVLVGLVHVHDTGFVHSDIKGANIVFSSAGEPRLTDFGVANYIGNEVKSGESTVGTAYWMAPEICACGMPEGYEYDKRCDVWSLGITAIELAEGQSTFIMIQPTMRLWYERNARCALPVKEGFFKKWELRIGVAPRRTKATNTIRDRFVHSFLGECNRQRKLIPLLVQRACAHLRFVVGILSEQIHTAM